MEVRQLRLAAQIYQRQGRIEELLGVLDDPDFGLKGSVAGNDWEFVRLKIELLEQKADWVKLFEYCHSLMQEDCVHLLNAQNDWAVWHALGRGAAESGKTS